MNEVQYIGIVAFFAVMVFIAGSYINRRKLDRYSRLLQSIAREKKVKYAPMGPDGFRARMIFESGPVAQLDMTVKLADRYNFMHYFLTFFTKDKDMLVVWCQPRDPASSKAIIKRAGAITAGRLSEEDGKIRGIFSGISDDMIRQVYAAFTCP